MNHYTYLEILGNLTNKSLEGKFTDKKLSGLLIATNFAQGNSSWAEAMGLLHTTSNRLQTMTQYDLHSVRNRTHR
jgi:hypothetical protein